MRLVAPFLFLLACAEDPASDKSDTVGDDPADTVDTDAAADTDVADTDAADTDSVDTTDTDPVDTTPPQDFYFVIEEVLAVPQAQGFDLDGDAAIDNAMGALNGVVNRLGLSSYGTTAVLAGTEVLGVRPSGGAATIGILTLQDTDGNLADNFTGTEDFALYMGIGAVTSASVTIAADGSYETVLPAGALSLGAISLSTATDIHVRGALGGGRNQGLIGAAVSQAELQGLLDALGAGQLAGLLAGLSDIDTDADGEPDAVSLALSFSGPTCVIQP